MPMNISDSTNKKSTLILEKEGNTSLSSTKDYTVIEHEGRQLIVSNPENTEVISLDGQYLRGEKGDMGETPDHQWIAHLYDSRMAMVLGAH